jgi:hypothetical protein
MDTETISIVVFCAACTLHALNSLGIDAFVSYRFLQVDLYLGKATHYIPGF